MEESSSSEEVAEENTFEIVPLSQKKNRPTKKGPRNSAWQGVSVTAGTLRKTTLLQKSGGALSSSPPLSDRSPSWQKVLPRQSHSFANPEQSPSIKSAYLSIKSKPSEPRRRRSTPTLQTNGLPIIIDSEGSPIDYKEQKPTSPTSPTFINNPLESPDSPDSPVRPLSNLSELQELLPLALEKQSKSPEWPKNEPEDADVEPLFVEDDSLHSMKNQAKNWATTANYNNNFWVIPDDESRKMPESPISPRLHEDQIQMQASIDRRTSEKFLLPNFTSPIPSADQLQSLPNDFKRHFEGAPKLSNLFAKKGVPTVSFKYLSKSLEIAKQIAEVLHWMESLLNKTFQADIAAELADGKYLCLIANKLKPGAIPIILEDQPFGVVENIAKFIKLCKEAWGLSVIFREVDVLKGYNPALVVTSLHELAQISHKINDQLPALVPFDDSLSDEILGVAVNYTKRIMLNSLSPR